MEIIDLIDELEKKINKLNPTGKNFLKISNRIKKLNEDFNQKEKLFQSVVKERVKEFNKIKSFIKNLNIKYYCMEVNDINIYEEIFKKFDYNICLMKINNNNLQIKVKGYDINWTSKLFEGIKINDSMVYTGEDCRSIMDIITRQHFKYLRKNNLIEEEEEEDLGDLYEQHNIEW